MGTLHKIVYRFIEIDFQYLQTPFPLTQKILDISRTNIQLLINLILKRKKYSPITLHNKLVYYDTPYGTKTLLTTFYDFYVSTKRCTILPQKPIIVDIGANIGQFLIASKAFYPDAEVYSFEPDSEVFELLTKNAAGYKNTKIYNLGLSNVEKSAQFFRSNEFSEWSGLKKLEGVSYVNTTVKLVKGDTALKNLKKIDLMKIDVEGAELEVLIGLKNTLKKCKYVLIEVSILRNKDDIGSQELLSFLFANNFRLVHIGRIFAEGIGKNQSAADFLFIRD